LQNSGLVTSGQRRSVRFYASLVFTRQSTYTQNEMKIVCVHNYVCFKFLGYVSAKKIAKSDQISQVTTMSQK